MGTWTGGTVSKLKSDKTMEQKNIYQDNAPNIMKELNLQIKKAQSRTNIKKIVSRQVHQSQNSENYKDYEKIFVEKKHKLHTGFQYKSLLTRNFFLKG